MAIILRERYTDTTQSFPGFNQARAALLDWLQVNHVEQYNNLDVNQRARLWEVGGHSPVLDVDYQYRIELPGRILTPPPGPQTRPPTPPGTP